MVHIKQQLPAHQTNRKAPSWEWLQGKGSKHSLEHARGNPRRSRVQVWLLSLSTSILLWTCIVQLMALGQLWQPRFLKGWPSCFERSDFSAVMNSTSADLVAENSTISNPLAENFTSANLNNALADTLPLRSPSLPPARVYQSNGHLLVSCNGGLNQMRAAICDMVAIARQLNLTLVVPELDKTSFWADPSEFKDIFDVKHFVASLKDEVRIVKRVPAKYHEKVRKGKIPSLPPVSWSNESYYQNKILPLIKRHKVLHFAKTDTRLANNGLSPEMQRLRCRVNYEALRFTPAIEKIGQMLLKLLQSKGPFVVLHLRYEMDMLAFSGCTHGCTDGEVQELTNMRYAYPWWKEKIIDSMQKRLDGLCPLTPEETVLVLRALGFDKDTQIYIAAGEIYGSERRLAPLHAAYPNLVRKESLLSSMELKPFQSHSSQMAALDYLVAVASDVFIPTYDGNMAKVVQGHRRYLGYRKTILLDHKRLVELLYQYHNGTLNWQNFSIAVQEVHSSRMGTPSRRRVIMDRPKEEEYFYANPEECLA